MAYHSFKNENGDAYGSFETFYASEGQVRAINDPDGPSEAGWYWWACFPGCLPDGEPSGPFATEEEAIDDAQNF